MCFYEPDYDWYASVVEHDELLADEPVRCDECRRQITAGEKYHHTFLQQYEGCGACERGDCECPPITVDGEVQDGCCQCEEPNCGETFDYDCCQECRKFLEAVQVAEEDAGCSGNETRPPLTEMEVRIGDGGMGEAKKYWKKAKEMHPELVASGYLARLWRRIFVL